LPTRWRNVNWLQFLYCLISPIWGYLDAAVQAYIAQQLYYVSHTGQVCYLQAVLNDTFDPMGRGIYIADGDEISPIYIGLDSEVGGSGFPTPLYLGLDSEIGSSGFPAPVYFPLDSELTIGWSFIVMVPSAVAASSGYSVVQLRALVDKYRLVSKNNYLIQTF